MTVLYVDVSHHDWARRGGQLDWAKIRAATSPVMIARATYGDPSGWNRPSYHHGDFHREAKAAGFDVRGSYANFIRGDSASIGRQVDWLRREMDAVGAVWAMADIERYPEMMSAGVFPRWSDVQRLNDRWQAVEDRVMAWYLPEWVWERSDMGRPDLRYLRGPLVSSRYPLSYTKDDGAGLYARCGGDTGKGWATYDYNGRSGYVRPLLWQFTSSALIPGTTGGADCNAFRGTLTELRSLLTGQPQEDDDMDQATFDKLLKGALTGKSDDAKSIQAGFRALPWAYPVTSTASALNVLFGQVLPALVTGQKTIGEAIARESSSPDEVRALLANMPTEQSIAETVLAGFGQRSPADILTALAAAGVDLDGLRAEIDRQADAGPSTA